MHAEIKVAKLLLFGVFWPLIAFAQAELTGQITHVRDGDTLEVGNIAIRLNGLTCDERGTALGNRTTAYLRSQVLRKTATCWLNGERTYDRLVGRCATEKLGDIERILSRSSCVDAARDMIQEVNMLKRRGAQDPMLGRSRRTANKSSHHMMVGLEGLEPPTKAL
jgi:hypothetical protein